MVDRLASLCERPGCIYLLNVPSVTAALILVPRWPVTMNLISDWANVAGSLLTFLLGFVICGSGRFLALVERRRWEFTSMAVAVTAVFFLIRLDGALEAFSPLQRHWTFTLVDSYLALAMILALVGWSRAKLNRDSSALRYCNSAVYPFYLIHQTITVMLGYAWLGWHAPFAVKFPSLCAGTFFGSWIFYEVVRRTRATRILFGMRALLAR
jgi:membrane-bound acyltransferase YfiQ involved in biofilm formation